MWESSVFKGPLLEPCRRKKLVKDHSTAELFGEAKLDYNRTGNFTILSTPKK